MSRPLDAPKLPSIDGDEVLEFGRVGRLSGSVSVHDMPDTSSKVQQSLRFNDRVYVLMELRRPAGWCMVATDDGKVGYIDKNAIFVGAPDPGASLHYVRPGETAEQIAKEHYGDVIQRGRDARFYVNVLVYANWSDSGKQRGIYKQKLDDAWDTTKTRQNYYIWVPSSEFASTLEGQLSAGSIQRDVWNRVARTLEQGWEWFKFGAGFVGGLIHGALECIWDMVVGLVDLVGMLWDFVKMVFAGEILTKARELWDSLSFASIQAAAGKMFDDFSAKWNHESSLKRGHFRGWVVGYIVATVLLMIFTVGAAAFALAGRLGALVKLVRSFKVLGRALDTATAAAKRLNSATRQARDALRETLRKPRQRKGKTPDHDKIEDELREAVRSDPEPAGSRPPKPVDPRRAGVIRDEINRIQGDKARFEYWQTLTKAEREAVEAAHRGTALKAKKWDLQRRKGDLRDADSIKAEELARKTTLDRAVGDAWKKVDRTDFSAEDWRFLQSERNRRLAFDVDGNGGFRVDEARTALLAEKQGVLKPPVQRAVAAARNAEQGADIIDGNRLPWDVKHSSMGADDIASTANGKVSGGIRSAGENVLVDARGLTAAQRVALEAEVRKLMTSGAHRVVFVAGG